MDDPIWEILDHQGRSLKWLARRTGYSYAHVKGVAAGQARITPEFRERCAEAFDVPLSRVTPIPIEERSA